MSEIIALLTIGVVFASYAARAEFSRYSIFTIGSFNRVKRSSVRREGHTCADCEEEIERGERRRYYKEFVLLGAPVVRYGGGTRRYCHEHADMSVRGDLQPVSEFGYSLGGYEPATVDTPSDSEFESVSDDVTASVSSAFSLIPVAMMVLFLAVILGFLQRLRPSQ